MIGKQFRITWSWALRTAWRDARGSRGKAMLYALSMALGIAALVAMGSFGADLDRAIDDQTRTLVGADLVVTGRQPFSSEVASILDGFPGESASLVRFTSMAYFPASQGSQLCRVRAVTGGYPFYGKLETEPPDAANRIYDQPYALVDASLMERVGAEVGDQVRLGQKTFTIAGSLTAIPGEPAIASLMGPRIFIPHKFLDETDLLQKGSLVFYSRAFRLPEAVVAATLVAPHEALFKDQRLDWETVPKRRQQLGRAMAGLSRFLNLIACLALLLGGLGVASAVHYHMQRKTRQIAVMRCLGATVKQVALVYLIQVQAMALAALAVGVIAGVFLQYFLPAMVADFLPFRFEPRIQPLAILVAVGWGLLLSLLLALAPLIRIRGISPLVTFRPDLGPIRPDRLRLAVYGIAAIAWWGFAAVQTRSLLQGAWFMGGLIGGVGLLYLTARLLGWIARKLIGPGLPFALRHGLANLFRPQNQTSVFLIILGLGVFLLTVLAASQAMLLGQFDKALSGENPNFIVFDIQSDQQQEVVDLVSSMNFQVEPPIPIVPMRLESIKGKPVSELMEGDIPEWMLRREYRSTYRSNLTDTERLIAGTWASDFSGDGSENDPVPVSLELEIARALGLELGDGFVVNVLGLPMSLRVASLREVDWESMQPNFYMVFPAGILEEAPSMFLLTTRTEGPEQVASLQTALVSRFPNISCVDLTQVVASVEAILDKAAAVVRFLAGLCMVTGFVLLAGAIWNGRYQRLGEYALMRTLGATRRQLAQITLSEYFLMGLFASVTGLVLAVTASWGLGTFLFELPPFPSFGQLLPPILVLPFLTLALGYVSLRSAWQTPPRTTLRWEGM